MKKIRRILGLKGSWKWARRKMEKGCTMTLRDTPKFKHKYRWFEIHKGDLVYCIIPKEGTSNPEWKIHSLTLNELDRSDWKIVPCGDIILC